MTNDYGLLIILKRHKTQEEGNLGENVVDPFDTSTKLSAGFAQDKFLVVFDVFYRKCG